MKSGGFKTVSATRLKAIFGTKQLLLLIKQSK